MGIQDLETRLKEAARKREWKYVIVHHSATKDSSIKDWETIRKWHTGKIGSSDPKSPDFNKYVLKPMSDIGYHLGIEKVAGVPTVQLGRDFTKDGGHAIGFNRIGFGLCVVGNFDLAPPPPEIWDLTIETLCKIVEIFKIPVERVIGHRETYALRKVPIMKTCPGKQFDMEKLRSQLEERCKSLI